MGEDSSGPPLSRRVPGATNRPQPRMRVAPPVLPDALLERLRAEADAGATDTATPPRPGSSTELPASEYTTTVNGDPAQEADKAKRRVLRESLLRRPLDRPTRTPSDPEIPVAALSAEAEPGESASGAGPPELPRRTRGTDYGLRPATGRQPQVTPPPAAAAPETDSEPITQPIPVISESTLPPTTTAATEIEEVQAPPDLPVQDLVPPPPDQAGPPDQTAHKPDPIPAPPGQPPPDLLVPDLVPPLPDQAAHPDHTARRLDRISVPPDQAPPPDQAGPPGHTARRLDRILAPPDQAPPPGQAGPPGHTARGPDPVPPAPERAPLPDQAGHEAAGAARNSSWIPVTAGQAAAKPRQRPAKPVRPLRKPTRLARKSDDAPPRQPQAKPSPIRTPSPSGYAPPSPSGQLPPPTVDAAPATNQPPPQPDVVARIPAAVPPPTGSRATPLRSSPARAKRRVPSLRQWLPARSAPVRVPAESALQPHFRELGTFDDAVIMIRSEAVKPHHSASSRYLVLGACVCVVVIVVAVVIIAL